MAPDRCGDRRLVALVIAAITWLLHQQMAAAMILLIAAQLEWSVFT